MEPVRIIIIFLYSNISDIREDHIIENFLLSIGKFATFVTVLFAEISIEFWPIYRHAQSI